MYKVVVKGKAKTSYGFKEELDGIDCHDCFSDYMDDTESCDGAVTGGYLQFEFIDGKLWSVTTYDSSRELTKKELKIVEDYTSGQWSDGIGEGFEQEPCHIGHAGEEVYISPWYYRQNRTITQTKN